MNLGNLQNAASAASAWSFLVSNMTSCLLLMQPPFSFGFKLFETASGATSQVWLRPVQFSGATNRLEETLATNTRVVCAGSFSKSPRVASPSHRSWGGGGGGWPSGRRWHALQGSGKVIPTLHGPPKTGMVSKQDS